MKRKNNTPRARGYTFITLVVAGIALYVPCYGGVEKPIEMSELPSEIMATANKAMPSAKFRAANTETESDGFFVYEIKGSLPDGRAVEVDIFPDGDIEEIEVEFTQDLVPGAVIKSIQDKLPGFKASYIEASYSASKKVLQYEFVGVAGGAEMDLEVSADGRNIVIADQ